MPRRLGAAVGRRARPAVRSQMPVAELAGEGVIAARVAERDQLVEHRRSPHVHVIHEPLTHVGLEAIERVGLGAPAHSGQIATHRLAVMADMAGDGRDGPAPRPQRCDLHDFPDVSIETGLLSLPGVALRPPASGGAPPLPMAAQEWCRAYFSNRGWGVSGDRRHSGSERPHNAQRSAGWERDGKGVVVQRSRPTAHGTSRPWQSWSPSSSWPSS